MHQHRDIDLNSRRSVPPPLAAKFTGAPSTSQPQRLAVLAHSLRTAGGKSVGRNLIAALIRRAPQHRYLFFIPRGLGYEEICARSQTAEVRTYDHGAGGLLKRAYFDLFTLPGIVGKFDPDWVLGLGNAAMFRPPGQQAILCQNAYCCYPTSQLPRENWKTNLRYFLERTVLRTQLSKTQLVLCQTSAYERQFRSAFRYRGEIALCPNAVSMFVTDRQEAAAPPAALADRSGMFKLFYVARYYNHKNLEAIVELFDRYRTELKECVAFITVSADQHPNAAKLLDTIKVLKLEDQIVNVGPLRQEEIGNYFRAADALLMPTLLESFSGTYLEAMHYGLPILTSNRDFARAVCGDAADYFDPLDVHSIFQSLSRLRRDPAQAETQIRRGRQRLSEFPQSWDDVVDGILPYLSGGTSSSRSLRSPVEVAERL